MLYIWNIYNVVYQFYQKMIITFCLKIKIIQIIYNVCSGLNYHSISKPLPYSHVLGKAGLLPETCRYGLCPDLASGKPEMLSAPVPVIPQIHGCWFLPKDEWRKVNSSLIFKHNQAFKTESFLLCSQVCLFDFTISSSKLTIWNMFLCSKRELLSEPVENLRSETSTQVKCHNYL